MMDVCGRGVSLCLCIVFGGIVFGVALTFEDLVTSGHRAPDCIKQRVVCVVESVQFVAVKSVHVCFESLKIV